VAADRLLLQQQHALLSYSWQLIIMVMMDLMNGRMWTSVLLHKRKYVQASGENLRGKYAAYSNLIFD